MHVFLHRSATASLLLSFYEVSPLTIWLTTFIDGDSFDNWFKYAQKEFEKRAQDQNPWLEEDAVNYEYFSLETKLFILTCLCEWQLDDPEQFRSNFKEEDEVAVEWVGLLPGLISCTFSCNVWLGKSAHTLTIVRSLSCSVWTQ